MLESVETLKRKLAEAEAREKRTKEGCQSCDGKGFICDTTYDRTGENVQCGRCYGTGFPADRVAKIIRDAFAPYERWPFEKLDQK